MKCKYCFREFANIGCITTHENSCKNYYNKIQNIINDYIFNLLSFRDLSKKYNISRFIIYTILKGKARTTSEANLIAHKLKPEKFKHSDKSKEKIKIARLKYMKEHPEKTAWRLSNMSYSERIFFEEISKNKNYIIEREKSFFPYFADFTILNAKVVIEIDGSQHNLKERKLSDQKKNELIISKGYRIIRFSASEVNNQLQSVISKVELFIQNGTIIEKSNYIHEPVKHKYYCSYGKEKI